MSLNDLEQIVWMGASFASRIFWKAGVEKMTHCETNRFALKFCPVQSHILRDIKTQYEIKVFVNREFYELQTKVLIAFYQAEY